MRFSNHERTGFSARPIFVGHTRVPGGVRCKESEANQMGTLMTEGGFPMFLVLAFGLATLLLAARFAYQPDGRSPAPVWSLAIVTVATTVTGVAADLAAVGHHAPRFLQEHAGDGAGYDLPRVLIQGFSESMAPAILGSTFVALAALLISVGLLRRSPASRAAASQAVD